MHTHTHAHVGARARTHPPTHTHTGADHVISYGDDYAFLARLFELFPQGVDCVYDSIGAATCTDSLKVREHIL